MTEALKTTNENIHKKASERQQIMNRGKLKVNQAHNKIRTGHVNIKLITNFNT
jgi:hypothetical protein